MKRDQHARRTHLVTLSLKAEHSKALLASYEYNVIHFDVFFQLRVSWKFLYPTQEKFSKKEYFNLGNLIFVQQCLHTKTPYLSSPIHLFPVKRRTNVGPSFISLSEKREGHAHKSIKNTALLVPI